MKTKRFAPLMMSLAAALFAVQTFDAQPLSSASRKHPPRAPRSLLNPASLNEQAPGVYRAKFSTTRGDFIVEVHRAWAPRGADRFYNLVKNKYYDGSSFFRVLPGFIVQFGISANPQVSKSWKAARIPDDPVTESNLRGYLTFATAGPNTRTTQVFINLADNPRLDGMGFSAFGKVTEGMEVVQGLYAGYGEGAPRGNGPDQSRIEAEGSAYLDKDFPKLDKIKAAIILPPPPSGTSDKAKEKP